MDNTQTHTLPPNRRFIEKCFVNHDERPIQTVPFGNVSHVKKKKEQDDIS